MPQRHFATRLIAGVIVLLSFAVAASAQNGRVSGIVRQEGGQPLKGATVTAENEAIGQTFTATTDDKGRFNMIGLRSGDWRFIAQAPGFSPEGGRLVVRSGGQNLPIGFELKHSGVAFFGALGGIVNKDLQSDLAAADALFSLPEQEGLRLGAGGIQRSAEGGAWQQPRHARDRHDRSRARRHADRRGHVDPCRR
jgi:Carboxypeptidase regulatory-like domain